MASTTRRRPAMRRLGFGIGLVAATLAFAFVAPRIDPQPDQPTVHLHYVILDETP